LVEAVVLVKVTLDPEADAAFQPVREVPEKPAEVVYAPAPNRVATCAAVLATEAV
jgi:hypothetical protein